VVVVVVIVDPLVGRVDDDAEEAEAEAAAVPLAFLPFSFLGRVR
jgi:hypothetical protein